MLDGCAINVFVIVPRASMFNADGAREPRQYWATALRQMEWCDRYGFSGMLIFQGNEVYADPWVVAQCILSGSATLTPLIAVNPMYMHPFTAARFVSSYALVYGRRVWLNLITGTALGDMKAMQAPELSHDERYEQLGEYATILISLLSRPGPTTFRGKHYATHKLRLFPRPPEALLPRLLLAGQSEAAARVARFTGAIMQQFLLPDLDAAHRPGCEGVALGIVARESDDEAWRAARSAFPDDPRRREILELSMSNTDSVWKARMKRLAEGEGREARGYWLEPFKNFYTEAAYFVGSRDRVSRLIRGLVERGVSTFILTLPTAEEDYRQVSLAFRAALADRA
jgi:alkanesulfonate monooxygenase